MEEKSKVYVAGSESNFQTVAMVQMLLRELGHTITFDQPAFPFSTEKPDYLQERWLAETKKKGIEEADALVLVLPEEGKFDCFIEAGIALGMNKKVFIVQGLDEWKPGRTEVRMKSIFGACSDVHYIWNRNDLVKIEHYLNPKPVPVLEVQE